MQRVLVDSSVWIDCFRKKVFQESVALLSSRGEVATCGLVQAELFPFFYEREFAHQTAYFQSMHYLVFEDRHWVQMIQIQKDNLKLGLERMMIPDLILVTLCWDFGVSLFTKDRGFVKVCKRLNIPLHLEKELFGF